MAPPGGRHPPIGLRHPFARAFLNDIVAPILAQDLR
jgi:hypothetical protein